MSRNQTGSVDGGAWSLRHGDSLDLTAAYAAELPGSVNCIVTSPPYFGLRDYGVASTDWPEVSYAPLPGLPGGMKVTVPAQTCCLGAETNPLDFVGHVVLVWRQLWNVLADDGTCWVNLGDSYASDTKWGGKTSGKHAKGLIGTDSIGRQRHTTGLNDKNLMGIPWRVAFALQADGWCLRQDVIWNKANPMPESVRDRCTKAHEYLFLLTKKPSYYFDQEAIQETSITGDPRRPATSQGAWEMDGRPAEQRGGGKRRSDRNGANCLRGQGSNRNAAGAAANRDDRDMATVGVGGTRNKRSVWTVATAPYPGAHFATFPPDLIRPCIRAGCPPGGLVLDPYVGSGTTGEVSIEEGRRFLGFDLGSHYIDMARRRIGRAQPPLPLNVTANVTALEAIRDAPVVSIDFQNDLLTLSATSGPTMCSMGASA